MKQIYLDNAATSFPKPPAVAARMRVYLVEVGAPVNRSVYGAAQQAGLVMLRLRQRLGALFGVSDPTRVILTPGCTWSLNLLLCGLLRAGDHVLVSAMEHNAVMRPLTRLAAQGVRVDRIPCDRAGRVQLDRAASMLRPETRLVLLCHASNVCGTVQDARAVGALCAAHGVPFALDAAQTAGHLPVDFDALGLSALAVPAHKGLLGPQGIGALLLGEELAARLEPVVTGGTGSASDSEQTPRFLPDRFEPGTPNLPGVYGWEAALGYLDEIGGVQAVAAHDRALSARLLAGLRGIDGVRLVGLDSAEGRVGVFSLDFAGQDNAEAADRLEREHGILTRCGLHCAPSAHRTLGTFPRGTVRLSTGWFTTEEDIDRALAAVAAVSAG